ncbi:glycoside hydrolase family 5 protein [uncultured Phycicoccus sp.]|uniref:glycoside hydrolase family 5 protein n=1 Tax=uncultured Phycicoccus sp. TaxID=661422 RepID=UPI00260D3E8F|nr:cellulase family glycosylhydrolase [uncultured Phycicoccus sp.]
MTPPVRAVRGHLVAADGTPLTLRGVGLGNWLLPEGYMWGFGDAAASPRQIEALVEQLVGPDAAGEFWRGFRDTFVAESDIAMIAADGFDHVRLPVNWRVLMTEDGDLRPEGLALVDRLVSWCGRHGLLVLLDLHGAPGGQTGTNIDDSRGRPELFMDPRNEELTVALWTALAGRYRDDPTVLGYDLLNEPLPNHWQHVYPDALVRLYRRLTEAIRAVDPDHLLMYEGTHWATNWDIFTEVWDPNSALQFHKYWSPPDDASIRPYLEARERLGLPIYMGEGGENSPQWLAAAHSLYERHEIGWNLWPWKKIETLTSPLSVTAPAEWSRIVAYAAGTGPRPSAATAARCLDELLHNLDSGRCTRREDVVNAVFRRAPLDVAAYGLTEVAGTSTIEVRGRAADAGTGQPDDASESPTAPVVDHSYPPCPAAPDVVRRMQPGAAVATEVLVTAGSWDLEVHGSGPLPTLDLDGAGIALTRTTDGAEGDQCWAGRTTRAQAGTSTLRLDSHAGFTLSQVVIRRSADDAP